MANESYFAVTGFVATQPKSSWLPDGARALSMRVAWTPRVIDKATGQWTDRDTSFVTVTCYRKTAENAFRCVRRGDPITVRGTLRVREYTDQSGAKRNSVDVIADSLGHDMSRGISSFTKTSQHAEQTAEEYELSSAAVRTPLPGDVAALGSANGQLAGMLHAGDRARLAAADDAADEPAESTDLAELSGPPEPSDMAELSDPAELRDVVELSDPAEPRDAAELADVAELADAAEPPDAAESPAAAEPPDVADPETAQRDDAHVGSRRGRR